MKYTILISSIISFFLNFMYAFANEKSITLLNGNPNARLHILTDIGSNSGELNPDYLKIGARTSFLNNRKYHLKPEVGAKITTSLKDAIMGNDTNKLTMGGEAKVTYELKEGTSLFTNYEITNPQLKIQTIGVGVGIDF